MKELLKIGLVVLIALALYDAVIKRYIPGNSLEEEL
jgi:hypothetical protein